MFSFYFLEAYSFLIRDSKGVHPDGKGDWEELGGAKGGKL